VLGTIAAIVGVFFVSDLVYTVDHYLVHFDKDRYKQGHVNHHVRYGGTKDSVHLDRYELSTYSSAAFMSFLPASLLTLFTGNVGFALGVVLKYVHTLLFHCYQHGWWGPTHIRAQKLGEPKRTWGICSAKYHAWHHSNPDDGPFAYAESWGGFDRILEWAHPWLYKYTVDGRKAAAAAKAAREQA
jgi:sterol desaturase/sphingolipid hydroxylase (fatty acid hydroxylase superfamily)